jgi:hypothetical protein
MNVHKSTLVERRGVWSVNPLVVVHECSTAAVCDEWCERVTSFSRIRPRIGRDSGVAKAADRNGGVRRSGSSEGQRLERCRMRVVSSLT